MKRLFPDFNINFAMPKYIRPNQPVASDEIKRPIQPACAEEIMLLDFQENITRKDFVSL